jgi:hypothetical protein
MSKESTRSLTSSGVADRARVACAAWLLVGFIGASTLAAEVFGLLAGDANVVLALILALCGGVIASAAWAHAGALPRRAERAKSIAGKSPTESAGAR